MIGLPSQYEVTHFHFHCSENPNTLQWNPKYTAVRFLGAFPKVSGRAKNGVGDGVLNVNISFFF